MSEKKLDEFVTHRVWHVLLDDGELTVFWNGERWKAGRVRWRDGRTMYAPKYLREKGLRLVIREGVPVLEKEKCD